MRTKILNYSIPFLLAFVVQTGSYAQNHFWTISPNYYDYEDQALYPLPTSPNGDPDYEGLPAQNAHNGIALPNGEILFFVVDKRAVYGNGEYICEFVDEEHHSVSGNSEICIVPDPRYCGDRYYIFMGNSYMGGSGSDNTHRYPYCAQIDMSFRNNDQH